MLKILILFSLVFEGCSILDRYPIKDRLTCKNHTFIYVDSISRSSSLPRAGIFPVIFDDNIRVSGDYQSSLTASLAQGVLKSGVFPIVEVIQRWEPVIKDEFFYGNHATLKLARDLGLDILILFFYEIEDKRQKIYTKVLDVRRNMTIYYGLSEIAFKVPWYKVTLEEANVTKRDLTLSTNTQKIAECVVGGFLHN
ncbi:MAG: hypothetical protein NZO16_01890 [Deltaproteobacteria bacterium]|nr:hypothetical protein [Deltaproteobacteria bacterium]